MYCEEKLKLRSHDTRYCLIEVGTKAGVTVIHLIPIITGVVRLIPSCGEVFHVTLILISLHSTLHIKPLFSDRLSYVTLFQCSLGRSHKTGFTK
jgi:hypothetical protein